MNRGEIWTVSGASDYAGKPRPAVIVQADGFDRIESITICPITSNPTVAPFFRLVVEPTETNGLSVISRLMVDKITTLPATKVGRKIGTLGDSDLLALNRAIALFLGVGEGANRGGNR